MTKDNLKGIKKTQQMLMAESIGYGVGGKIAGDVDLATGNHIATNAFSTGASLAGVPSLMSGTKNVMDSLNSLYPKKKK
jgi:hypothetical protein